MSAPVFVVDADLSAVRPGDTYVLDGAEGRHAAVVQRRGPGERLDVVDGAGTRLRAVVGAVAGQSLDLLVQDVVVEPAALVRLVLVQALAKGDRDHLAVEAAVEVGVDAVMPWQADRSVVVWRGARAVKARDKWASTVRAAVKQARRAWEPPVDDHRTTAQLAAWTREVVAAGGAVLVLHEEAELPLADAVLPAAAQEAPDLAVVVGPEGGISGQEVEQLVGAGAVTVRLGPHVLRTSTAGPVAVALLSDRLGRWR